MTTEQTLETMKAMASLYRKKAAVMKALEGGMVKTGENTHFKYKYVTASRIKHAVSRLLVDNGLSLQMSGLNTEDSASTKILRIQFQITLCDLDTGATESSFWFGEAQATDDKAASKCATSALKYYLISNLMIADKDEDRRDTDREPRKQQPAQTQQAATQAPAPAKPTVVPAPHWSADKTMMDKMYAWAMKEHKYTPALVDKAIATVGKKLSDLARDEVKLIVADDAQRIPF